MGAVPMVPARVAMLPCRKLLANRNDSHYIDIIMIVCVCHRVSDRDIAAQARSGCPDFDALQDELRVGTACGACIDCAHDTFQAHTAHAPRACAGRAQQPQALGAPC
jgi:bacterioferritin-associated ferredoxin